MVIDPIVSVYSKLSICRGHFSARYSQQTPPANTKRNKHVIITSKRRFDVIITCLLRCVFAGHHYMAYFSVQNVTNVPKTLTDQTYIDI